MDSAVPAPKAVRTRRRKQKLPPNVVPHRDKFRGKLHVDGRLFQSPSFRTPEEAAEWVARFRKNQTLATAGGPITLAQAWKLVCEDMAANGVRDGTRRFAEDKYRALTRAWPDKTEMHRIGAPQVRAYMAHRREKDGVGGTTIRAEAVLLKRMFRAARSARGALLLESHGVRVFSLVEYCDSVDAFSFRRDDVPFVFLNTRKSAERSRFDACHELGHLVLHGHASQGGREAEVEADRFASAFLMPKSSVLAHVPPLVTLDRLVQMKKVWKVSVGALIQRLHSLDVLTEWKHRALWMEASQRGYRKSEPESTGWESSQILGKVFTALSQDGVSRRDLARELHIPTAELDALVFGLTMSRLQ